MKTIVPEQTTPSAVDLDETSLYLNRELTWLSFNQRVLSEAADIRNPLLERLKFLAIVGSNLDEFFMKRIGGLKQQSGAGVTTRTADGRTPEEQIDECYIEVRKIEETQRSLLSRQLTELREYDIAILNKLFRAQTGVNGISTPVFHGKYFPINNTTIY